MRQFTAITAVISLLASTGSTLSVRNQEVLSNEVVYTTENLGTDASELRVIETAPGETRTVTEAEKWNLKRSGVKFMDITDHLEFVKTMQARTSKKSYSYPSTPQQQKAIKPLLAKLTAKNMETNLAKFTSFYTRYFKSATGRESSEWLLSKVNDTASANSDITVAPFIHSWGQNSVIAHIPPGKKPKSEDVDSTESKTHVVIGAHQDSVNMYLPMYLRSPGADDDGSGTVTILEAFRVLAESGIELKNPVEFHWYSAEEGGLLGSQDIFSSYAKKDMKIGGMLQQDMTGYTKGTLDAGKPEAVGVITDFVDAGLTEFIKKVITEYCDIPFVETKCGYACSDHASASKAGYPSAFVIESEFRDSDQKIHTSDDLAEYLNFNHMLQHAKLTLALAVELGLSDLE